MSMEEQAGTSATVCSLSEMSIADSLTRLNPIARVLLEGLYDEGSELYKLQGMWHVMADIWGHVTSYWESHIEHCISKHDPIECLQCMKHEEEGFCRGMKVDYCSQFESYIDDMADFYYYTSRLDRAHLDGEFYGACHQKSPDKQGKNVAYFDVGKISFPASEDIDINMMPFILSRDFASCKLPEYLKPYWNDLIQHCYIQPDELTKVGYLTIQESYVDTNASQRRPGIHTESPGILYIHRKGGEGKDTITSDKGNGSAWPLYSGWGGGTCNMSNVCSGGIYMASTVQDSCRVWDCKISEEHADNKVTGDMGDIEHLRYYLTNSSCMKENRLYWLTDRTPHESLPLDARTYRQFFRLVTSQVSVWFQDHSTENPLGIVPDPNITRIVKGSKFDKEGVVLVRDIDM